MEGWVERRSITPSASGWFQTSNLQFCKETERTTEISRFLDGTPSIMECREFNLEIREFEWLKLQKETATQPIPSFISHSVTGYERVREESGVRFHSRKRQLGMRGIRPFLRLHLLQGRERERHGKEFMNALLRTIEQNNSKFSWSFWLEKL